MTANLVNQLLDEWPPPTARPCISVSTMFGPPVVPFKAAAERDRLLQLPDLGWRFARRQAGLPGSPKFLAAPTFKWVRAATTLLRDGHPGKDKALRCVAEACALRERPDLRPVLHAALITPDATSATVAAGLGLDPEVVECYSDLFFNVMDRRDEKSYVRALVHPRTRLAEIEDEGDHAAVDLALMRVAFHTDLATLLAAAGYGGGPAEAADDPRELSRRLMADVMANARPLVAAGWLNRSKPPQALAEAMKLVREAASELLAEPETKSGESMCAAILAHLKEDRRQVLEEVELRIATNTGPTPDPA
jgi:hypothetical protein